SQKALIMQILNYAYWLICLVIIIIDAINPNIVPLKVQFIIILIYFSMWVVLLIYGLVIETISEIKLSKE
ncbi:MAG: hypothetical protein LBV58_02225, partial [Acholeplasmatales bacterium]|nr:hypothetical protein [Acholeplasmatales bacterium]